MTNYFFQQYNCNINISKDSIFIKKKYTLFKIKISSYLFMYGPRQTDSVSLITFSSYLSRIYFAICLNHIQAVNQFSTKEKRTEFETFVGLDNYNFILYIFF